MNQECRNPRCENVSEYEVCDECFDALAMERGYRRAWTVPASGAWHLASWGGQKPSDVAVQIYAPDPAAWRERRNDG